MRTATELLAQYAAYHRDRRNIVSHFIGVPMIVFGVGVLLARPTLATGGLALTPAWLLFAFVAAWYLTRGSAALGVSVSAVVALLLWLAQQVSGGSISVWLAWGAGFFARLASILALDSAGTASSTRVVVRRADFSSSPNRGMFG